MQAVFPLVKIRNPLVLPPTQSVISARHILTKRFKPDKQLLSVASGEHLPNPPPLCGRIHGF